MNKIKIKPSKIVLDYHGFFEIKPYKDQREKKMLCLFNVNTNKIIGYPFSTSTWSEMCNEYRPKEAIGVLLKYTQEDWDTLRLMEALSGI